MSDRQVRILKRLEKIDLWLTREQGLNLHEAAGHLRLRSHEQVRRYLNWLKALGKEIETKKAKVRHGKFYRRYAAGVQPLFASNLSVFLARR
jgi:hypothetical protein